MRSQNTDKHLKEVHLKADKIMLFIIGAHFFFATFISSISYDTYIYGLTHGGFLFFTTLIAYIFFKGQRSFRILIGVVLMTYSALFIQQHLGRIEFHFHIFVAISFLTIYKDYLPTIAAGITTAAYHLIFNYLQEQNIHIFGQPVYIFNYGCSWDIVFLHIFFATLEVTAVSIFIIRNKKIYLEVISTRNKFQNLSIRLEDEVLKQTFDLRKVNKLYKEAQSITHYGNWEWDMTTNHIIWNDEIYHIFNLEPQSIDATYEKFISYVHPNDRKQLEDNIETAILNNLPVDFIHRILLPDNIIKYVHEQAKIYKDENNKPIRMVGTIQDISSEVIIKNELEDSEEKFRIMSEKTNTAIFIFKENFIYANEAMENVTGYSKEELELIHPTFIIPMDDIEKANRNIANRIKGDFFTEDYDSLSITTKDGEERLVSLHTTTIPYKGGFAGLGTLQDITEIKKAQEEIKTLSQVVEQTDDIVKITTADGILTYVNDAFVAHTGYTRREVIGKKPNYLKSGKHSQEFYKHLWETILSGNVYRTIFTNRKKDGNLYYEEQTITPILNEKGIITSFVSTGKDITERMILEGKLKDMATLDKLTNTYNRYKFEEILNIEIERFKRHQTPFSFIMLDIDHFKNVNDTYGHDVGDSVLVEISVLLKGHIRNLDSLCRWGGEEFIILCPQTTLKDAKELGEKLRLLIEQYQFKTAKSITSSFGVTNFKVDDDQSQALKRLDNALYMAKEKGRNCVIELS